MGRLTMLDRFKTRRPILLAAGLLVVIVASVFVVFRAGDSGEPDQFDVAPAPSTTTQPGSTATGAAQAPTATVTSPLIGPIEDGFVRSDFAPGEIPDGHGVIFIDAQTGAGEFWSLPRKGRPQNDYYARYAADETRHWLWVHWTETDGLTNRTIIIADRESGKSYRFDIEHWTLVAGPTRDGLLIAQSRADTATFAVVDLGADPTAIAIQFSLPGEGPALDGTLDNDGTAVRLADETTLLLAFRTQAGEIGKPGGGRAVSIDLATGEAPPSLDLETTYQLLSPTTDGGAVLIAASASDEASIAIYRFDPSGALIGQKPLQSGTFGSQPQVSPDGRWLTWLEHLPLPTQSGVGASWQWPVIMLADLDTGEVTLRVVRADPVQWLGDRATVDDGGSAIVAWQQWRLAAESGLLIKTPQRDDCGPPFIYVGTASPGCIALLHLDGTIETLPSQPDAPFDVESETNDRTALNLDGTELRIQRSADPGRDFGGGVSALPLPPRVQRPPFSDEVTLQVSAGGDGLNVRAEPRLDAEVLGTLPDGTRVTVTSTDCTNVQPDLCAAVAYGPPSGEATFWLHVETTDGLSGWAVAQYLTWAE